MFFHKTFYWEVQFLTFLHFLDSLSHTSTVLINISHILALVIRGMVLGLSGFDCSKKDFLISIEFRRGIFFLLSWKPDFLVFCFHKAKKNIPKLSFPFLKQVIAPFFEEFVFQFKDKLPWKWYLQALAQSWTLLLPALEDSLQDLLEDNKC